MAGEWDWLKNLNFTMPPRANQGGTPQTSGGAGGQTLGGEGDNPFLDWLEGEEPWRRALYTNFARGMGGSRAEQNYWAPRYENIWNQYYAQPQFQESLARGEIPTQRFSDYLSNYGFKKEYQNLAPWERGERPSTFAPGMRWNVY